MNYIFVMSISGTAMFLIYSLIHQVYKRQISNKWKCLMLKCAVLYYLVPLPFLKNFYGMLASLMTMLVFANSLTVLAYEDITYQRIIEAEEKLEAGGLFWSADDMQIAIVPETAAENSPFYVPEPLILYANQFVDGEGNIYPLEEALSLTAACRHDDREGEQQHHIKKNKGACEIQVYEGKYCTKCHAYSKGELKSKTEYTICNH